MKNPLLRYTTSKVGSPIKIIAVAMFAAGAFVLWEGAYYGIILVTLGILPFVMTKQIEFDLYGGLYREGYSIAGKLLAQDKPFPGVDCLFLKKNRYSGTVQSRATTYKTHSVYYDGFILMSDGLKILAVHEEEKAVALQKLQQMAKDLQVEVRDLS